MIGYIATGYFFIIFVQIEMIVEWQVKMDFTRNIYVPRKVLKPKISTVTSKKVPTSGFLENQLRNV